MTSIFVPAAAAPRAGQLPAWAALIMALAGGCLLGSALSLHPQWWAAWAAPVPLYAAALAGPPGRGRWIGALAGTVAGASLLPYTVAQIGWPPALLILGLRALAWSLTIGLAERSARVLPAWLAVLLPALSAAGLDTLVLSLSPHGANGSLAHSQMEALAVVQAAAIGGAPAIVFLVLLGGGMGGLLAARLMGASLQGRPLALAACLVLAVQAVALGLGAARLQGADDGARVPAALVVTDQFTRVPDDWPQVWRAYGPAVEAAARPGSVVLLPEKIARLSGEQAQEAAREVSAMARAGRATVVVGLEVREGDSVFNRALVAQPDGAVAWYDKRRPVPGREAGITPGRSALMVAAGGARAGVAICKDMHFAALGRGYGRSSAALVLVPAWDFDRDGWIAERMTALRGIESGYAIARSTRNGVSSLRDRFGRIVVEGRSEPGVRTLHGVVTLPTQAQPTFYARAGDLFGWSCLALAMLLVGLVRRRMSAGPRSEPGP